MAILLLTGNWAMTQIINNFHLSIHEAHLFIAYFTGWSKLIITLFFLFPALALHWTVHSLKKTNK